MNGQRLNLFPGEKLIWAAAFVAYVIKYNDIAATMQSQYSGDDPDRGTVSEAVRADMAARDATHVTKLFRDIDFFERARHEEDDMDVHDCVSQMMYRLDRA